jgi:nucleoside 2-deoxyribosyltransferase
MNEQWLLKIYLAGYSKDLEYRRIVKEKYGDKLILVDPMTITWIDVNKNVNKNVNDIWLIRRDKKLINDCDMLVARCEYLPYGDLSIGTYLEIMYAYDHGIPVFLISSEERIRNNAWLKFHYKKAFSNIDDCFNFILSSDRDI